MRILEGGEQEVWQMKKPRMSGEGKKGGFMNNLKKRREELHLTQKQVADALKVGIRLYQYYEADQRKPNVQTAIEIADVLKTTVEKLFRDSSII